MALYYGQVVIGPAGSGKSTYCHAIQDMASMLKRRIMVINLDPAAESFKYRCDIDIRDLISLDDVMQELSLGPNGGLVYCLEYLLLNMEWLQEELNHVGSDDYVLIDCPGQIELYTHLDLMARLTAFLANTGFSLCTVYMLDVNFITDDSKYLSGILMALSASMAIQLPHFTVLSKCDLVPNKKTIKRYLKFSNFSSIQSQDEFDKTYEGLSQVTLQLIEGFGGLRLLAMDLGEEDSVQRILNEIDYAIQWGENAEPDDKMYDQVESQLLNQNFQQMNL